MALLLSVEAGAGGSTAARSLNRSAVKNGMLCVLIDGPGRTDAVLRKVPASSRLICRRSSNCCASSKAPLSARRYRADFGSRWPSCAVRSEAVALAGHADLVILVVREGAASPAAIAKVRADLSRFGSVPTALVVNRVAVDTAARDVRGEALGMAS